MFVGFYPYQPFELTKLSYNNAMTLSRANPTQDTGILICHASQGLSQRWQMRQNLKIPVLYDKGDETWHN
jgi:hypothetical protein